VKKNHRYFQYMDGIFSNLVFNKDKLVGSI
jgi:hypothetical protein